MVEHTHRLLFSFGNAARAGVADVAGIGLMAVVLSKDGGRMLT